MSRSPKPEPKPQPMPIPEARPVVLAEAPEPTPPLAESAEDRSFERAGEAAQAGRSRILTPRTGRVTGVENGRLLVDYPGNLRGPLPARTTVPLDARGALSAAAERQGALLVFEDGDPGQPIVIGLIQAPVATLIDLVLEASSDETGTLVAASPRRPEAPAARGGQALSGAPSPPAEGVSEQALSEGRSEPVVASADGKSVVIEGEEEVTLRCGKASISLRRDGRVVVKGAYVETHASGTNRIKGGSVQIN